VSRLACAPRRAQGGAILFIALIVLVAMSLAGLALMRSVDTGSLIASNLAFKQSATAAGDEGIEAARGWLLSNGGPPLYADIPASAYYATMQNNVDLIGSDPTKPDFDWSTAMLVGTDAAGNTVKYVIQRLCDLPGDPASVNCIRATGASSSSTGTKGAVSYGGYAISVPTGAFYRITVQVAGPRNTLSYVQATVY
jgi:type IV pilus assembly protein PilX